MNSDIEAVILVIFLVFYTSDHSCFWQMQIQVWKFVTNFPAQLGVKRLIFFKKRTDHFVTTIVLKKHCIRLNFRIFDLFYTNYCISCTLYILEYFLNILYCLMYFIWMLWAGSQILNTNNLSNFFTNPNKKSKKKIRKIFTTFVFSADKNSTRKA